MSAGCAATGPGVMKPPRELLDGACWNVIGTRALYLRTPRDFGVPHTEPRASPQNGATCFTPSEPRASTPTWSHVLQLTSRGGFSETGTGWYRWCARKRHSIAHALRRAERRRRREVVEERERVYNEFIRALNDPPPPPPDEAPPASSGIEMVD